MSKKSIKSDLARLDRMKDADIDYSDIPPLGKEFLKKAAVPWPPPKQQLTIRLDTDVLAWLRAAGRGYQTRINRILRAAMESQPERRRRSTPAREEEFSLQVETSLRKAQPAAGQETAVVKRKIRQNRHQR